MNNHDKIKRAFDGLKAPDGITEKILASAGTKSKAMKNPHRKYQYHIGRIAIVALAFVLMTVTALAIVFPELRRIGKVSIDENTEYGLEIGVESGYYPFTEKLRNYIQQNEGTVSARNSAKIYGITFASFEEAAEFFGVPIAKINFQYESPISGIIYFEPENDSAYIYLIAKENIGGLNQYTVMFGINEQSDEFFSINNVGGTAENTNTEIYLSPTTGIEAGIALYSDQNSGKLIFSLDDVTYSINMQTGYENFDELADIFKNIVDTVR